MVTGGTTVRIFNGTLGTFEGEGDSQTLIDGTGNVYGGGMVGRVQTDTKVTIGIGAGSNGGTAAPIIAGNVFGAGAGVETHGYSALVRGTTEVTIQGNAKVGHSVYGGGEIAAVGQYGLDSSGMPSTLLGGGDCTVTVKGYAKIGPENGGNVFGAGKGVNPFDADHNYINYTTPKAKAGKPRRMMAYNATDYPENAMIAANSGEATNTTSKGTIWEYYEDYDENAETKFVWEYYTTQEGYFNFLQTLALATDTEVSIEGHASVKGSVYGGSESGFVQRNTNVEIQETCTIGTTGTVGNVFGGGHGVSGFDMAGRVRGNATTTISGGAVNGNVYGGGALGFVGKFTYDSNTRTYTWYEIKDKNNQDIPTGLCTVTMSGGSVTGHVFGAGMGEAITFTCEPAMTRTTSVSVSAGSVGGNVYGGGEVGRVDQNAVVTIGAVNGTSGGTAAPVIAGNVFGAGAGVETHGYSALVRGNTDVTIQGNASVGHNVYGGGMIAAVGKYGLDDAGMPSTLLGGGECKVTVKGYAKIGPENGGNVFGAGMGVNPNDAAHNDIDFTTPKAKAGKPRRMMTYTNATDYPENAMIANSGSATNITTQGTIWEYYENYDEDAVTKYIWEYYTTQEGYFKFLQTLALATDTKVDIEGSAKVYGSVYGGSESGFVQRDTDVKIQGSCSIGTTGTGGVVGNVFGGGKGVSGFDAAGRVRGNTNTYIINGTVTGNVYGGGELGLVGLFTTEDHNTYNWQTIKDKDNQDVTTGLCTLEITNGSVGGNVFGASKGEATTFRLEQAMVRETSVSVTGGSVTHNVYGGGEVGRVDQNSTVTIGAATGDSSPHIGYSVFGAGEGVATHGYSALVRGNTDVTIQNHATVGHSVYGGGEIASVGQYGLDDANMPNILKGGGYCYVSIKGDASITADVFGAGKGVETPFNNTDTDYAKRSRRMTLYTNNTVFLDNGKTKDGNSWEYYDENTTPKLVWEYFESEEAYASYLTTLALATHPEVTIEGNAAIGNDVYGGGERGITKGSVIVNINGGTITRDVYGGGALADTNTTSSTMIDPDTGESTNTMHTVHPTTTVNLHGGIIGHNVYGGGLGSKPTATDPDAPSIAPLVYGNILVNLNENTTDDNCIVKGVLHGANNYNGSPKSNVTVHVYKTTSGENGWTEPKKDSHGNIVYEADGETPVMVTHNKSANKDNTIFDLKAVYGGGNEATYEPTESTSVANVIIEGCDLTSIETVYGGGNAASVSGTNVVVKSCYEIGTLFGGGNGKDDLDDGTANPGANVGYKADGTTAYGTGEALAELRGGTIHSAFGGSNTKGNVRVRGEVTLNEATDGNTPICPLCVEEVYGAGNEADQDGSSNINLGCISYLREIYGGAKNADVNSNVELTIQSGRFDRVFGGNNIGGCIRGSITVNIEETGCHPIIIGQLFGGGNQAAYSIYGYDSNGNPVEPTTSAPNPTRLYADPQVNVKSFTSIGDVYGGGFGASAVMVGNPYVTINECVGDNASVELTETAQHTGWTHFDIDILNKATGEVTQNTITLDMPTHTAGAIGGIGNVFGGGNEAPVHGNTNVLIGQLAYVPIVSVDKDNVRGYYIITDGEGTTDDPYVYSEATVKAVTGTDYYQLVTDDDGDSYEKVQNITVGSTDVTDYYIITGGEGTTASPYVYSLVPIPATDGTTYYKPVIGVNITGNVYGGGNAADVSGDTNVKIGTEDTSPTNP